MLFSHLIERLGAQTLWLEPHQPDAEVYSARLWEDARPADAGMLELGTPQQVLGCSRHEGNLLCCMGEQDEQSASETIERLQAWRAAGGKCNLAVYPGTVGQALVQVLEPLEEQGKLAAATNELVRIFSAGQGLGPLIARAGDLTGLPIVLIDNSYRIISCTKSFGEVSPDYARIVARGQVTPDRIQSMKVSHMYQQMRYFKDFCLFEGADDGVFWLDRLVYVSGSEAAHFGAIVDPDDPLRHYPLLAFLCELISIELEKENYFSHDASAPERAFIRELLEGDASQEHIDEAVQRLGWHVPERMELMPIASSSGTLARSQAARIAQRFFEGRPDVHQALLDGRLVALVPALSQRLEPQIQEPAGALPLAELAHQLDSEGLVAAASDGFSQLIDAVRARRQAASTLDAVLAGWVEGPLASYSQWALADACNILAASPHPFDLCPEGVLEIARDDQRQKRDWLDTLEGFLRYDHDPNAAAEYLGVHRNTLFYRVNRMRERYGLELEDGRERLRIMMGIQLLKSFKRRGTAVR